MRFETLEFFEKHPEDITTGNILCAYIGVYNRDDLIESITNEYKYLLAKWSSVMDVKETTLLNYINYYYDKSSKFAIISNTQSNYDHIVTTKLFIGDLFILLEWTI